MFVSRSLTFSLNYIFSIVVVFGLSACLAKKPEPLPSSPPPLPPVQADLEHVVKFKGETLGIIANWYTGKTANWSVIQKANTGLKPEKIRIGDKILIPSGIVVKNAPLPEAFVKGFVTKSALKEDLQKELDTMGNAATASEPGSLPSETSNGGTNPQVNEKPDVTAGEQSPGVLPDDLAPSSGSKGEPRIEPDATVAPSPAESADQNTAAVKQQDTPSEPTAATGKGNNEDAERERLLDELLSQ